MIKRKKSCDSTSLQLQVEDMPIRISYMINKGYGIVMGNETDFLFNDFWYKKKMLNLN